MIAAQDSNGRAANAVSLGGAPMVGTYDNSNACVSLTVPAVDSGGRPAVYRVQASGGTAYIRRGTTATPPSAIITSANHTTSANAEWMDISNITLDFVMDAAATLYVISGYARVWKL
jgi:hypothetical protein